MNGNMKDRIKLIRSTLNLTQQEFATRIGLKQNSVAAIESGRPTSEQTIFAICREFNVNESWLRTGEGEMLNAPSNAPMDIRMSAVKERIIGAVTIMSEDDAENIWQLIQSAFALKNVPVTEPDEWDQQMLREIESDPDCHEFVPASQAMKELGL